MLHRISLPDELITVPMDASAFEKHATADSDQRVVLLLVLTSLAFLLPARASFYLGRLWHTCVFTLMAVICAAYHLFGSDTTQWLTLVHHGWAYFCFLQMAFLVLGPEDPQMQWIDHPVAVKSLLATWPPLHVIVLARVLPVAAILVFLCRFSSWVDFHWQIMFLSDVLLVFGCGAFWMHRDRRSSMPKVLLRSRFWRRFWNHFGLPGLLAACMWGFMESTDSRAMHAILHLLIACLAMSIVRAVHNSGADLRREAEIMSVSPQNPVIAHILLGSAAIFGLPTLMASLALDWWSIGYWRWPMVCSATYQLPGGYFVVIGALPTLMAQAVAFGLISSTVGSPQANQHEIAVSKQFGCMVGYVSIVFGVLTLAMPGPAFPTLHTLCLIAYLCLMMVATLLTTLSTTSPLAPGMRSRCVLAFTIFVSVMGFLMLLILVQQYIPNTYSIPHPLLATSEYIALALPMLWPLTWGPEVQARWQTHKSWQTFTNTQMSQMA